MNDFHLTAVWLEIAAFIWFWIASISYVTHLDGNLLVYLVAIIPPIVVVIVSISLHIFGLFSKDRFRGTFREGPRW